MAIAESDLEYRLSGGASNTDPTAGLGGAMSTAGGGVISGGANSIFDDITGAESAAGDIEYRCIYIKNKHATLTLKSAVVWISQDATSSDDATAMALTGKAVSEAAETVANESTAPSGPTFSAPSEGSPLSIGDLVAGAYKGIWIRRTITAGASPKNEDTFKIKVSGETAE